MITVSHASRALVARAASLRLLVAILVAGGRVGFQAMIVLAHLVSFHCSPLLAVVSKVVEDVWVGFKVFAILPLTIGFMMMQMPLVKKYHKAK